MQNSIQRLQRELGYNLLEDKMKKWNILVGEKRISELTALVDLDIDELAHRLNIRYDTAWFIREGFLDLIGVERKAIASARRRKAEGR